ncbi:MULTISPECIES: FCD domain-containing protein [Mameliella]|uniref:GntR family transcriptional regulator n=1 Tax=Mameliella alba TaxID=561184 RepID=A0A0B3RVZ6_9RHOB|nr:MULTISPECIES: FCD domain-containing protein [Mameliella]MBV6634368.1 FCD domain-containing protein [Mameliella sp.]MCR9273584.1 FCD domain-containing protein [Paracoccaceae bacterium]KHQ50898.1 GntR family transcriptional regulator [Mameliella alba]MBY6122001.1 FCD domain-containing protein [Mameliella alba]OWV40025.1 GntR family transcriptional regulator [Mameliella alba]
MQTGFSAPPRKSLTAHVESQLRDALIEGRLEPGTRLVTKELATSLGMSITPVREALVRFAASGVLTAEPASSFRVPVMTVASYAELGAIRKRVESLAAETAAQKMTAAQIDALEQQVQAYIEAKHTRDPHEALKENKELRFSLYAAAEMPILLQTIETLWLRAGPGFNYLFPDPGASRTEHANYEALIKALRAGDAAAAGEAICRAIDDGSERVSRALAERERQAGAG